MNWKRTTVVVLLAIIAVVYAVSAVAHYTSGDANAGSLDLLSLSVVAVLIWLMVTDDQLKGITVRIEKLERDR